MPQYVNTLKYELITVEKTTPPEGMAGDDWHRYVIGQGNSQIVGTKPGSLKAVTEHAEAIAQELNSRMSNGNVAYAPRKRD